VHVTLIFNPVSGGQETQNRLAAIHGACRELGVDYELLMISPERPTTWAVERVLKDPPERVWVCGGDGTVTAVGAALLDSKIPLAILPGGTANAIARSVGVPARMSEAVKFAAEGPPRPFDAVRVNGRISLLTAGAGYDSALIATATEGDLKRRFGILAYIYAALKQLGASEATMFEITADGAPAEHCAGHCLLLANIGKLFGEIDLLPEALPDDARMDIAVLTLGDLTDLLSLSGHVLQGTQKQHAGSRFMTGTKVEVRFGRPLRTEVDGDVAGITDHFSAEVLPGALSLVRSETARRGLKLPLWAPAAPKT
jgi:YegS/Rv2252/BmrU family lipid kinase